MDTTFTDKYFKLWMWVLPISSISLFPAIHATTPAYILALFSLAFVFLLNKTEKAGYAKDFVHIFYVFFLINGFAQFGLLFSNIDFMNASLIDYHDRTTVLFRSSMFTQSIYFLATIATFLYVKHFYNEKWNKYIFTGAIFLCAYGLYEFVYFLLFHQHGDFLSNRVIDGKLASIFAVTSFAGQTVMRLKSLTGEPSMAAFTLIPFWIYAIHLKKKKTHLFILLCLLLTFSGTATLGIIIYAVSRLFIFMPKLKYYIFFLPTALLLYFLNFEWINTNFLDSLFGKMQLSDASGVARFSIFSSNMDFFGSLNVYHKLFGVGFGYTRSTDYFSTVLTSNGVIGLIILSILFLYPVVKLKNTYENVGLKCIITVTFVLMMVSVPEIYYLSTWLFLGIAYNQLRAEKALFYFKS